MVELKTAGEIETMRESGRLVARVLEACAAQATTGTSLLELDELASDLIADAKARSSFRDYHPPFAPRPYPGVICASVNDVVVHGIPDGYRLRDGDLLTIDFGAEIDGFHGDAARTVVVGTGRADDIALTELTRDALNAGIAAARPGGWLGDIAHVIGGIGRRAGYGIPAHFGGHGVGRAMHEEPFVPNTGNAGRGLPLKPGLVIAIEPMFMAGGSDDYDIDQDGWALRASHGRRAAHAEHTIAITEDGPLVLTAP